MGRIVGIALVLAALAGVGTAALGGVKLKPEEEKVEKPEAPAPAPAPTLTTESTAPATTVTTQSSAEAVAHELEPQASGPTVDVTMRDIEFEPATVNVSVNQPVRWRNRDDVAHDVYAIQSPGTGTPRLNSDRISPGGSYTFVPVAEGTVRYVCSLHPTVMTGTLEVAP